ncbi:CCT domain [Dillenia turbinata]|uniref:CCT domain n=1 Tax=Dillenia turbinata TaxID=194707 RepID=A0AAN8UCU5_9MAGN
MCNKNNSSISHTHHSPSSMVNKTRKTRTRTRKPKFLSLKLQITPKNHPMIISNHKTAPPNHQHQLNLFPLHPENLYEEKDIVADFFAADNDGGATLTGLLTATDDGSLTSAYAQDSEENTKTMSSNLLELTALRRERDVSEEKWVSYNEVLVGDRKEKEEEVSSCVTGVPYLGVDAQSLSLKLDYQEILNAWSDKGKGSLYIEGAECPQTVPDLHDDFTSRDSSNVNKGLWVVPEKEGSLSRGSNGIAMKDEVHCGKTDGEREARVLRYKEKRRSRLFAKRIRYEVRKLNAEKRPRIKGRFVKRG